MIQLSEKDKLYSVCTAPKTVWKAALHLFLRSKGRNAFDANFEEGLIENDQNFNSR